MWREWQIQDGQNYTISNSRRRRTTRDHGDKMWNIVWEFVRSILRTGKIERKLRNVPLKEKLSHPPYSQNLALNNYFLFRYLKKCLGWRRIGSDDKKTVLRTSCECLWEVHASNKIIAANEEGYSKRKYFKFDIMMYELCNLPCISDRVS